MKTNMIKTAALTLAMVISVSVNAQNTKSFRANKIGDKLDKFVKENMTELTNSLNNLKAYVQFKPETQMEYTAELHEAVIDLSELESIVKYVPSKNMEFQSENYSNEMDSVLSELKEIVKYKPQAQLTEDEGSFKKISEELAMLVRYKPQS